MAYEMVTGAPPFTGPTPTAVLMRRLQGPPPSVTKTNPDVPQALADVIMGCLAQDPAERFQTAGEVVAALGGATPVSGGMPTAEFVLRMRRSRRRWALYAGGGLGLVAAAAVAGVVLTRGTAAPRVPVGMIVVPAGEYLIGDDRPQASSWPFHGVALDSFAIDSTEVTVGQYRAYADASGKARPWGDDQPNERWPVTGVNFPSAVEYCAWRGTGGRLPTEQEWEAAARGDQGFVYPWATCGSGPSRASRRIPAARHAPTASRSGAFAAARTIPRRRSPPRSTAATAIRPCPPTAPASTTAPPGSGACCRCGASPASSPTTCAPPSG